MASHDESPFHNVSYVWSKERNSSTKKMPVKVEQHKSGFHGPIILSSITTLLLFLFEWPWRWLLSGAPLLQLTVLLGASNGYRVLPFINLYPLFTTLHLVYAVASTSWLLYDMYALLCYPAILLTCLFQFNWAAHLARVLLRMVITPLHFIDDKIAFFDIPALEIDTEVDGLMVLRGITFSLSTLSFVVHGCEVGIKLTDDMELAIQTERVEVRLFRGIWVGDCFANLKGGKYEMTFGDLDLPKTEDQDGDQIFVEDTPLLKAAGSDRASISSNEKVVKMTEEMTDGHRPAPSGAVEGLRDVKAVTPNAGIASGRYQQILSEINETGAIYQARKHIASRSSLYQDTHPLRAAIASQLHSKPSVPHPPSRSIKVTTLQNLASPHVKRFLHRLPMLLRLLLNPLSYFHPVNISSITATASGVWIESMLITHLFDAVPEDSGLRSLKARISAWLTDANFAVELGGIVGQAQVPFLTSFDILSDLSFEDVLAYRALTSTVDLKQVVRLGGADLRVAVPTYLLPHHEHLLPPPPSATVEEEAEMKVLEADGRPKVIQAAHDLKQVLADETNVKLSVHARLPAILSQELITFVAAVVKGWKVVEIEKEDKAMDAEVGGIVDFGRALKDGMKEGMRRKVVDTMANDRVVAKLVGKVLARLEEVRGEVGWTGDVAVPLAPYRNLKWENVEGDKLLR